uniref:Uncharacterized protein n=1 Tax=Hordeum vulgare subsp. vulgare TaxID=112509 RepID=A0A8I6WYK1_HORVV
MPASPFSTLHSSRLQSPVEQPSAPFEPSTNKIPTGTFLSTTEKNKHMMESNEHQLSLSTNLACMRPFKNKDQGETNIRFP